MKLLERMTAALTTAVMLSGICLIPVQTGAEEEGTEGTYKDLYYTSYSDHVEVTGCEPSLTKVDIPEEIDGLPVTTVSGFRSYWSNAYQHEALTSVTIPDSVTTIKEYAFSGCSNLESVTISSSVTEIGKLAFFDSGWMQAQLEETGFFEINGILLDASCSDTVVVIPDSVTAIGDYGLCRYWSVADYNTYFYYSNVETVIIPDGVTTIGSYVSAPVMCIPTSIERVNVTDGISLEGEIYYAGTAEQWDAIEFVVDEGDPEEYRIPGERVHLNCDYAEEIGIYDGMRYINRGEDIQIIGYDESAAMVEIPAEIDGVPVRSIGASAFEDCWDLTAVTIPEGVTSIEECAFRRCGVLVSITLPKSLEHVSYNAFSYTYVQQDVWYAGSKRDWLNIDMEWGGWEWDYSGTPNIHYGSTEGDDLVYGDINGNGEVDTADASGILLHIAKSGAGGGTYSYWEEGDIDSNGAVEPADASMILMYIAKCGAGDVKQTLDDYLFGWNNDSAGDIDILLNTAELNPQANPSFYIYDHISASGKEKVEQKITVSDKDIAIIEKFAEEHFPEHATLAQKLFITHQWIHYNTDYAYVGEKWDTIVSKTYVDAIFNYKLGQCVQYNGAMAALLAYYGYDVYMYHIEGHFSTTVTIDGKDYDVEVGNYGKNGEWQDFFWRYEYDE